jgi:hypothetical protein
MRQGLRVGLVLAAIVCLFSFGATAGWARLDGTSTEIHKRSRLEIGQPWVWYYEASEYREWPGGYEGWDEWRVLASPAWVLLPAAVGLFLLSRQFRTPAERPSRDSDHGQPPRAEIPRP